MIIIAGHLLVEPTERAAYLEATAHVAPLARAAGGCLDFVQVADPVEADRIVIYERWDSDDALTAFRTNGPEDPEGLTPPPELQGADVAKFRVSGVEAP